MGYFDGNDAFDKAWGFAAPAATEANMAAGTFLANAIKGLLPGGGSAQGPHGGNPYALQFNPERGDFTYKGSDGKDYVPEDKYRSPSTSRVAAQSRAQQYQQKALEAQGLGIHRENQARADRDYQARMQLASQDFAVRLAQLSAQQNTAKDQNAIALAGIQQQGALNVGTLANQGKQIDNQSRQIDNALIEGRESRALDRQRNDNDLTIALRSIDNNAEATRETTALAREKLAQDGRQFAQEYAANSFENWQRRLGLNRQSLINAGAQILASVR
jgi:hypothetical protein